MKQDGKLPKAGFVRFDEYNVPKEYHAVAVFDRTIKPSDIKKYDLVDLNAPAKKLTILRLSFGMKQSELAEITGLSIRTIQGWELNGMSGAAIGKAYRICKVLHCSLEDLLEDDDLSWTPAKNRS